MLLSETENYIVDRVSLPAIICSPAVVDLVHVPKQFVRNTGDPGNPPTSHKGGAW